jgi:hypothetical protein
MEMEDTRAHHGEWVVVVVVEGEWDGWGGMVGMLVRFCGT